MANLRNKPRKTKKTHVIAMASKKVVVDRAMFNYSSGVKPLTVANHRNGLTVNCHNSLMMANSFAALTTHKDRPHD